MYKRLLVSVFCCLILSIAIILIPKNSANETRVTDQASQTNENNYISKIATTMKKKTSTHEAPTQIIFDSTNESSTIKEVGTDKENRMYIPDGLQNVYWYKFGPSPGEKGNAIIAGHRDWGGELGLFQYLEVIKEKEKVTFLYANDTKQTFVVKSRHRYSLTEIPIDTMNTQKGNQVTLISCTGNFDKNKNGYQSREIVILEPEK
ncbi:class F sortase [Listeria newyorkensis]|uniref:class F sortase n=1 Tax=Listeria newyorkensis TaxID=1497681 RepID=UPI0010F86958|nr:class F sortase [Listeria newyorkensis]